MIHGPASFLLDFTTVEVPMIAALARSRAHWRHYLRTPMLAAAVTVGTGLGLAALRSALDLGPDVTWLIGAPIAAGLGWVGGRILAYEPEPDVAHRRGTVIDDAPPAAQADRAATQDRERSAGDRRLTIAGVGVPQMDEAKHFKLIGTTGTGKSTAIGELLQGALARGDRAVIADPDAGYVERFYSASRGDVVLNPFDARSRKWDLFAEIDNPYDVEQLARSLIPDHPGGDRSWRGYARTFFTAVTRQLNDAGIRRPDELFRLLYSADVDELRTLLEGTPAQPFLNPHNAKMLDSIRSVTGDAVKALEYIAAQDTESLSVRQWVREERPGVLFMPYRAGQIAALGSSISAWMRLAIFETMHRPETAVGPTERNRPIWFVADELDALGPIDGLKDALARLRKFSGHCLLGFQSIAQVSSTYGQGDAHTIVENCGNTLILRCSASEGGGTARFASQLIGDREILQTSKSTSYRPGERLGSRTESQNYRVEPAVMPSQIEQLPDLAGYLKFASDPVWRRVQLTAQRMRDRHAAAGGSADTEASRTRRQDRGDAGRDYP
jgi:type IV secretory pathway TraG/TraD family ATPase VirD4